MPRFKVYVSTVISLFVGAASASIVQFITTYQGDVTKIDWHRMGMTAAVSGGVAVAMHYATPPNKLS